MGESFVAILLLCSCRDVFERLGELLDDDDFARIDLAFFELYDEKVCNSQLKKNKEYLGCIWKCFMANP